MTSKIRKLGIKKIIFLSLFGLIALAYTATPLIALACPGANNNGDNGGNNNNAGSDAANNNGNNGNNGNNKGNNNGKNNNGNNNANNNNGNNNNNNNQGQVTKRRSRNAARINPAIVLTVNGTNFPANRIACMQILSNTTQQPIAFKDFETLTQSAQTKGQALQVQAQFIGQNQSQVCKSQSGNQVVQPLATTQQATFSVNPSSNSSQQIGEITIKTDNQQITLVADPTVSKLSFASPSLVKVPLRFSDGDGLLQTNGSRSR